MALPLTGQALIAVTDTAVALTTAKLEVAAYEIKAPRTNALPVWIGASTVTRNNGHQLDPGDTLQYEPQNRAGQTLLKLTVGDFFVNGTSGDKVTWLASP